jgi:3-methyl-2-oxobutanoate hydroxymethyltransferase
MTNKIEKFKSHKNKETALVCLTAYTTPMAQALCDQVDLLLVGDSLGMVMYGMDNTLDVTLEMMIGHGKAVMRGVGHTPVIVDLPAGTYETSPEQALSTARHVIDETGCDGVKLEGGVSVAPHIKAITQAGICVMGHIGLLPQSVIKDGGFKVKGKTPDQIDMLIADAKAVEKAGAFAFVIEGTIDSVSDMITGAVSIPTIGIGASARCDGQILVSEDMLGLLYGHTPKFAKQYARLNTQIEDAAKAYATDVRARNFPSAEYTYQEKKAS